MKQQAVPFWVDELGDLCGAGDTIRHVRVLGLCGVSGVIYACGRDSMQFYLN
jgi:hypothetical protein